LALEHALRPLFAYLHAVVVPTAVFAASEDWGPADTAGGPLSARVERAAIEFAALVCGAGSHTVAPDPFETPTPFEQLLDGM
jgi:FMN reductase